MNHVVRASSRDLLACFFEECEKQFRFLERQHGFLYLSGLAEYRKNYKVITPYLNGPVKEPFLALTRYEKGERAVEILYGEDNFTIEIFMYLDAITRLSLKDLMLAMRIDSVFAKPLVWMTEIGMLRESLEVFAKALQQNDRKFLNPSEKLIDRALTMRGKLTEQTIRAHYEVAKNEASEKAAQAFVRKNYGVVVEILEPFIKDLGAADLKKLKRAQEKLGLPVFS